MNALTLYKEQVKNDIQWMREFRNAVVHGKTEASLPWKESPEQKALARELDAMLGHACQILPTLKRSWGAAWAMLTSGVVDDYNEVREDLRHSFESGTSLLTDVYSLLKLFATSGYPLKHVERLGPMVKELRELEQNIFANWTEFTQVEVEKALKSQDNLPLDEAFAEIVRVTPEVWRKRVASSHSQGS